MTICSCSEYQHLDLTQRAIRQRIKTSKKLLSTLTKVGSSDNGLHRLYRCEGCGTYWQEGFAWAWGAKYYLFQVPPIAAENWLALPYVEPHEMLVYSAQMTEFFDRNDFHESAEVCRIQGCERNAMQG